MTSTTLGSRHRTTPAALPRIADGSTPPSAAKATTAASPQARRAALKLTGLEASAKAAPSASGAPAPRKGRLVAPGVRLAELPSAAKADRVPPRDKTPLDPRFEGLAGKDLILAIRESAREKSNLGYRPAREAMFGSIDNHKGEVECVYTGRTVRTEGIPNASGKNGMNAEHAWPQSKGVKKTPAKSDLHHLFPSNSVANSRRGNLPFGEVLGGLRWDDGGSRLGRNTSGETVFEPRDTKKGDIARALFYISAVYGLPLPKKEEATLRKWHEQDPPSTQEKIRTVRIGETQGNMNPFVLHPELVDRIPRFNG